MFDEPSLGLAPILVAEIFKILKRINQEGVTVLVTEQNTKQTLEISNRGYVLENGRVVLSGSGQELLENEHVKEAYLGI
jgi:branched-chain amino acid transport system ATP-binding protein